MNAILLLLLSSSLSEPEGAEGAGGADGAEGASGAEGAERDSGADGAEGAGGDEGAEGAGRAEGAGGAEGAEGARDPPSKLHLLKEYCVKKVPMHSTDNCMLTCALHSQVNSQKSYIINLKVSLNGLSIGIIIAVFKKCTQLLMKN